MPIPSSRYAGFPGLLEPRERSRRLFAGSVFLAFPGQEPGHGASSVPSYVCISGGRGPGGPHPPRSLEGLPGADGAIEGPIGFSIGRPSALWSGSIASGQRGPGLLEPGTQSAASCLHQPGSSRLGNREEGSWSPLPPWGKASPLPTPLSQSVGPLGLPPLFVLGARRFAAFVLLQFSDARLLGFAKEAAPRALQFLSCKAGHLSMGAG